MADLKSVTTKLGKSYKQWKRHEKDKNQAKSDFFAMINEIFGEDDLALETIQLPGGHSREEAIALALRDHPTYRLVHEKPLEDGGWLILLEENPEYKPYMFINATDKMVYQRQVVEGGLELDDEAIKKDDPKLYKEITEPTRVLRPLEDLTPEQLAAVAEYTYPGKPTVKLPAPRQAKEEELEDDN